MVITPNVTEPGEPLLCHCRLPAHHRKRGRFVKAYARLMPRSSMAAMLPAVGRGTKLQAAARAAGPAPPGLKSSASAATSSSSAHYCVAASTPLGVPNFTFAPGEAGAIARRFVSSAKHPAIIIQDVKGQYKPICHEFTPRHGRSTFPILMNGHPDDVPGGPMLSHEAAIHERKQREKRAEAAAADPQLAEEQRRKHEEHVSTVLLSLSLLFRIDLSSRSRTRA